MALPTIQIKATRRDVTGSAANRRLRNTGALPGVIYAEGKPASNIQLDEHAFEQMLARHASESLVIDLQLDSGDTKKVLLKEVQHHPLSSRLVHVDFYELALDRKVRVKISLVFQGIPVGVQRDGGTLDIHMRTLEVECLPLDILEQAVVDVSALELGGSVEPKDVLLDSAKYRILTHAGVSLATVVEPKVIEEATPAAVATEGAAPAAGAAAPAAAGKDAKAAPAAAPAKDAKAKK